MKLYKFALVVALVFGTAQAQNFELSAQNSLNQITVPQTWARGITGQTATIAVIDQGFDLTHKDFLGKIQAARNFYNNSAVTWGVHGTAMAGVAAAARNGTGIVGVAPDARLIFAQVGPGGSSNLINESALYRALDWSSSLGSTVINLSLGASYNSEFVSSVYRNPYTGIHFSPSSYGINYGAGPTAINNYKLATDRGSIIVAAAGNQGLAYSEFPGMYATRTDVNGKLVLGGRMIVVGAVDSDNRIASFSNRAGHLCQTVVGTACKDSYLTKNFFVVAPGVNVPVSQPNQLTSNSNAAGTMSGTSPAAAYVSGGIALMRQAWPQLKPEQLVNLVLITARDLGAPGADDVYGRGLADFNRATQPQGALTLAGRQALVGQSITGTGLSVTGASMSNGLTQIFRSTSVIQNTQVVDEVGRNYAVNLTEAIRPVSMATNPDSPWLGYTGFQQITLPLDNQADLTVMTAMNGTAVQTNLYGDMIKYTVQLGSMTEQSGFLGNRGSGGMGLGSSSSSWTIFGLEFPLTNSLSLLANLGYAQTMIQNDPMSMIDLDPKILSRSWRLGLRQGDLTVSAGIPATIYNGQARVSGVVGYIYEDVGDQTVANPIVQTQTVDLRLPVQEYNLTATYRQTLTKSAIVNYNLVQRFNAGGTLGNQTTFLGVNLTWIQ